MLNAITAYDAYSSAAKRRKNPGAVCTTRPYASLGISPTSVVVSLGLATYARRYARRRLRPGVTSPGLPHAGKFPTSGFYA